MNIGDFSVIADVGLSIVKLLRDQMTPDTIAQPEQIGLSSPAEQSDFQLTLFLYNITESGEYRQTTMLNRGIDQLQYPPMTVQLHYLLTAHSNADLHNKTVNEHRILGRAMQVLHDNSVLRTPYLQGTLAENGEEVRIVKENLDGDQLMNLWNFFDVPYRLSVNYTAGPVHIDSNKTRRTARVGERQIRIEG